MLEFKQLELSDLDIIKPFFNYSVNKICDNSVGGALMWRDFFQVKYAMYNDTIIFKSRVVYGNNITAFSFPLGKDIAGSLEKIVEYCAARDLYTSFHTVTSAEVDLLETFFPNFELFMETDWSDYIYHSKDLRALSGRKYHGQRNHMNFFKKEYPNHSFEVITPDNLMLVKEFYLSLSKKLIFDTAIASEEHARTIELLDNYDHYALFGGLLKVDDAVVAFSVGENINNVMFVHIEKADITYRGAFQVINNELVKYFATDEIEYINREEDVGDAGLRYSKQSYHPCEILDKYIFLVVK